MITNLISASRTTQDRSFDDTCLARSAPTFARSGQVKFSDDTTFVVNKPLQFITAPTPTALTARVISKTPKGLAEQLDDLMTEYDQNGLTAQETAVLHPYGMMGLISEDHPEFAKALLAQRLNEFEADVKTWSWLSTGNRERALQQIKEMRSLLVKGQCEKVIAQLQKLEKTNSKITFCQVLNAKFMAPEQHNETELFKPFKNGNWLAGLCEKINTDLQKTEALADASAAHESLQLKFDALKHRNATKVQSGQDLIDYMILADPTTVSTYLKSQCKLGLQNLRLSLKANTGQLLTDEQRVELKENTTQLQKLGKATTRTQLEAFLADPANASLKNTLTQTLVDVYIQQLHHVIVNADFAGMTKTQLHEMVNTGKLFKQMMATYKTAQVLSEEELEALQIMETAVQNFERAERIHRVLDSEKHKPVEKRLFALNVPPVQRLMEKLTRNADDSETTLYKTMETLFNTEVTFHADRSDKNLTALQKARFDARRQQQQHCELEIRAALKGRKDMVVLTSGEYDNDIKTLKNIHKTRQKLTPVRPVGTHAEGVYQLARTVIWDKERAFPQIMADLEQAKTLQKLGYSMEDEFLQMLMSIPGMNNTKLRESGAKIIAPGAEALKSWKAGNIGFLQALNVPGKTYKAIEKEAQNTLKAALDVAERNPDQFRHLFGDISLIMDQLKSLLGPESVGLLTQLQNAARAHSIASCFAADEPVLTDVELGSDLAKNIKRFQLLCDMAAYTMHTTTAMNFVKNVFTGNAATLCAGVSGALGGLFTFGAAAPACAALGYAVGTALTVGNAAVQTAGTYAIREGLSTLSGEQVRMLDKVVNYGPTFMTATSPYDLIASGLRNVGKGDSLPTAIARTALSPVLTPFSSMYKAIKGIYNGEEGCWKKLGVELAIASSAVALTAALGGVIYATGFAVILGSPVLGAALGALATGYAFLQLMNRVRTIGGSVYSSILHYQMAMFNSNNPMIKKVRTQCEQEAQALVARMMDHDLYYQRIQEETMKELHKQFWTKFEQDNAAAAQTHTDAVKAELEKTEAARQQLVKQVNDSVKAIATIEDAIKTSTETARSDEKLQALKARLNGFGIDEARINRGNLALTLQIIKEEQLAIIEKQCGTTTPGDSDEAILNTLEEHYTTIVLGGKLVDLLGLDKEERVEGEVSKLSAWEIAEEAAQQRVIEAAEATATKHYEERAQLALTAGLTRAAETQLPAGTPLTAKAMQSQAVMNTAIAELDAHKQLTKDSIEAQANGYEAMFSQNEAVRNLPEADVKEMLSHTSYGLSPNAATAA